MKRIILITMLLAAVALSAAFVPLEKAKRVAENYYGHYCSEAASKGSSVINVLENKYEGLITRYTFEFDKGFVIVTADDGLYPILGYSDHGKVPKADQNGGQNFKEWFENYDQQVFCAKSKKYIDEDAAKLWKDIENNIFPAGKAGIIVDRLVKSEWGINYPWNASCPLMPVSGLQTETGCVANAMAQIMRYHNWPDVGVGSASYTWNPSEGGSVVLSADFTTHTWNYDLMPEILNMEYGIYPEYWETGISQAEKDELSLFTYWAGLSVDMMYGTYIDGGSGTFATYVDNAFIDHWKGTSAYSTFYTPVIGAADASYNTIKAELDARRPWFWAGSTWAFILDGYRDDYWYHFNWGWEGNYDGWFHRSSLIPTIPQEGDYSAGQLGITYVPSTNPFTAWPATTLSGLLANGEDVSLNWISQTGATGYKIYRTKDNAGAPTYLSTTTGLTFNDNDLSEGEYAYHIVVTYSTGESHNSNSYRANIEPIMAYPFVNSLNAVPEGRTSIDLAWTKPFTDILYHYVDFDSGYTLPAGWLKKTSYSPASSSSWTVDPNTWIVIYNKIDLTSWFYQSRIDGNIVLMSAAATQTLWLFSPPVTFADGSYIKWWNRFRYTDDSGVPVSQRPVFQIISYSGNFSEVGSETNIVYTQHALYDGSVSPENIWEYEETCDLSALDNTTTRVGIRVAVNTNDRYTLAFDKITIASTDSPLIEDCSGYEIYRNGTLAKTISGATTLNWSDTGFVDGDNTYYIKALYPTGTSIPSEHIIATMDANPKPGYLTGVGGTTVELSWYAPYHNPPKWYCYYDPANSTNTIDFIDPDPYPRRRTLFRAEDLGFYYPVTLDSVAIGFYDWNEGNWGGNNTFTIRILTGGAAAINDTIYTSGTCTAIHNQIYYHKLPTPMVLSEPWNVEITTNSTGYPGTLAGKSTTGSTHSYYYNPAASSYNYGMSIDGSWYEWAHMSYVTSSAPPPMAKSGRVSSAKDIPPKRIEAIRKGVVKAPVLNPKALDYYKIYRNGVQLGTSTTTNYTDSNFPVSADYTYSVSAFYANPVGESDLSNEIVVYGESFSFPPPLNVTTTVIAGNFFINWNDIPGATSYNVYASENPYGTFTLLANVPVSEYTYTQVGTHPKMFFYIVGINDSKEPPKTIEIPEKVK